MHSFIHSWQLTDPPAATHTHTNTHSSGVAPSYHRLVSLMRDAARCLTLSLVHTTFTVYTLLSLGSSQQQAPLRPPPTSLPLPTDLLPLLPPAPSPSQESHFNRQDQFSANWASGNCSSFLIWCWTAVKTRDLPPPPSIPAAGAGVGMTETEALSLLVGRGKNKTKGFATVLKLKG